MGGIVSRFDASASTPNQKRTGMVGEAMEGSKDRTNQTCQRRADNCHG